MVKEQIEQPGFHDAYIFLRASVQPTSMGMASQYSSQACLTDVASPSCLSHHESRMQLHSSTVSSARHCIVVPGGLEGSHQKGAVVELIA